MRAVCTLRPWPVADCIRERFAREWCWHISSSALVAEVLVVWAPSKSHGTPLYVRRYRGVSLLRTRSQVTAKPPRSEKSPIPSSGDYGVSVDSSGRRLPHLHRRLGEQASRWDFERQNCLRLTGAETLFWESLMSLIADALGVRVGRVRAQTPLSLALAWRCRPAATRRGGVGLPLRGVLVPPYRTLVGFCFMPGLAGMSA